MDVTPYLTAKRQWSLTSRFLELIEFWARLTLVNVPSYIIGHFPEVDRISAFIMSYLLFQIVGLVWAFLVNAGFAIACRASTIVQTSISVRLLFEFYVYYATIR